MSVVCATPLPPAAPPGTGRHRSTPTRTAPVRPRWGSAVDLVGRLGSIVTLVALVVLGGAVGVLLDAPPSGTHPTETVTFDGP